MGLFGNDIEKRILQLFSRGDAAAMDVLYAHFSSYLTGVAARYITSDDDLKDILQESLIKIFTQIGSFHYDGKGSLRAWMTRIVINEALIFLRKSRRRGGEVLLSDPPDMIDDPPDVAAMSMESIVRLIRKLPDGYREVFNMHAIDGLSHRQIAQELGIKPDTSASQYHRAKALLRKMIIQEQANSQTE